MQARAVQVDRERDLDSEHVQDLADRPVRDLERVLAQVEHRLRAKRRAHSVRLPSALEDVSSSIPRRRKAQ
jgi:hypothetical protein